MKTELAKISNVNVLYFAANVLTRYVSESGSDMVLCGQKSETPCRTMHQVLTQLLAQPPIAPPDVRARMDGI